MTENQRSTPFEVPAMRFPRVRLTARRKVIFGMSALGVAALDWLRSPGLVGVALAHVDPLDTEFSSAYCDLGWLSLRHGMTEREVVAAIGPPLRKAKGLGEEVWAYSRSPGDTHFWKRTVRFQGGRIVGFDSGLYFD
jgi:hypothetical protein